MSADYTVCFAAPNGTGRVPVVYTLERAKQVADQNQADPSNKGLSFYVRHNGTMAIVYRASVPIADTVTAQLTAIVKAPLPKPVAFGKQHEMRRKNHAAMTRQLFKQMGLKGISVTTPTYSMAQGIKISLPGYEWDDSRHTRGEYGHHVYPAVDCPLCKLRWAARERIDQIVRAAFPGTGDRSDYQTDYFDYDYSID